MISIACKRRSERDRRRQCFAEQQLPSPAAVTDTPQITLWQR
jgi:hypothetical protein